MSNIDMGEFAEKGLFFSKQDAQEFQVAYHKGCLAIATVIGASVSAVGIKSLVQPMKPAPKGSMKLLMLLSGVGVGVFVSGAVCKVSKFKIQEYIDTQENIGAAIQNLNLEKRRQLIEEAQKILKLYQASSKIDDSELRTNPNYT